MSTLNTNLPLAKRLENRKADKGYLNNLCGEIWHGFNGEGRSKEPIVYFERQRDIYWRNVQYADKVINLRYQGYFTDREFQEGTLRGIVAQLPARNGEENWIAGYEDSDSDSCVFYMDLFHDKESAARYADSCAEQLAEKENEYQEQWRRERDIEDKTQENVDLLAEIKTLRAELVKVSDCGHLLATSTLRDKIHELIRDIRDNQEEIKSLSA